MNSPGGAHRAVADCVVGDGEAQLALAPAAKSESPSPVCDRRERDRLGLLGRNRQRVRDRLTARARDVELCCRRPWRSIPTRRCGTARCTSRCRPRAGAVSVTVLGAAASTGRVDGQLASSSGHDAGTGPIDVLLAVEGAAARRRRTGTDRTELDRHGLAQVDPCFFCAHVRVNPTERVMDSPGATVPRLTFVCVPTVTTSASAVTVSAKATVANAAVVNSTTATRQSRRRLVNPSVPPFLPSVWPQSRAGQTTDANVKSAMRSSRCSRVRFSATASPCRDARGRSARRPQTSRVVAWSPSAMGRPTHLPFSRSDARRRAGAPPRGCSRGLPQGLPLTWRRTVTCETNRRSAISEVLFPSRISQAPLPRSRDRGPRSPANGSLPRAAAAELLDQPSGH